MVHNHSNANKRTDFEHSYLLLFIYLFLDFYLTLPIHISLVTYLCLHEKKNNKQTNKNSAKIHILHQDLNPRHRDDTLSDFNNYINFYIMSASHEFTIFVFSIY
jgi:hypothetical protein